MSGEQGPEIIGRNIRPDIHHKIKIYDFKRPDKFSKEQIRTLSIMHEAFARLTATTLTMLLRTDVKFHVAMVDQVTYGEFIAQLPYPTVLPIVKMTPLKGVCLFEYPNEIAYEMIERIYGGGGMLHCPDREVSSLEIETLDEVHGKLMSNFREAWSNVADITPSVVQIEINRSLCTIVPPTEMIVYVKIECKIGETESEFNIAYPYITIEPIVSRLSAQYMYSPFRKGVPPTNSIRIGDLDSELVVAANGPELTPNELIDMKPGDYIELPDIEEGEGYLLLNGTPIETCSWETPESIAEGVFELPPTPEVRPAEIAEERRQTSPEESVKLLAKEIVDELKTEYRSLSSRLDDIAGRQDDLTDQIAFSENIEEPPAATGNPFSYISADDAETFVPLLGVEHPQTIAFILSHLEPHAAAAILGELSGEQRVDVSERLSALGRVSPEAGARLDRNVRKLFDQYTQSEFTRSGGMGKLVEILNVAHRSVEKEIIETLESKNADLAENIKKRMFIFEDIVLLDTKAVSLVMAESKLEDVALALRGVSEQVPKHVYEGCEPEFAEQIRAKVAEMGPARLSDVEKAQMKIVSTIRMLEDRGSIRIARAGEEIV